MCTLEARVDLEYRLEVFILEVSTVVVIVITITEVVVDLIFELVLIHYTLE
jgi:hypothetical protein